MIRNDDELMEGGPGHDKPRKRYATQPSVATLTSEPDLADDLGRMYSAANGVDQVAAQAAAAASPAPSVASVQLPQSQR